ncbi:MAG: methylenetetrahydrofolate reductase C-terminal domain-containing protein [Candidatus Aureabacteria bacterium]|nr:methylenetetrahydrofolate reductase C-terminal domain-containing protein [Candidatus Auribacterota bacterium]
MIVTTLKDIETIKAFLKGYGSIAIIGCGACAAACQTGGKDDVMRIANILSTDFNITVKTVVDEACHHLLTRKQLRDLKDAINNSDCLLAMTCGAGVQCLAELFPDKKTVPSSDTHILGNVLRVGQFKNYCSMCGECTLDQTEGFCTKTRCPKSHVNGPCGGMHDGKCEVFPDKDCVFISIYNKRKTNSSKNVSKDIKGRDFSKKIDELELPRKNEHLRKKNN